MQPCSAFFTSLKECVMNNGKLVHIAGDEDSIRRSLGVVLKTSDCAVEAWTLGQASL
jgi:FixJ family two-component response regulator